MVTVILDFEEEDSEVMFGMDNAEVNIRDDGSVSAVFEDYVTGRTIEVTIDEHLLNEIERLRVAKEYGCHYVEDPRKHDNPFGPPLETPF